MRKVENECVGCPPEMGCLGSSCRYANVERFYCDYCGDETTLYDYDGDEICKDCLIRQFKVIEGSEW